MKNCVIVGASGYSGAQLVALIDQHPKLKLIALAVSEQSDHLHQSFSELYPQYTLSTADCKALELIAFESLAHHPRWSQVDILFLATPHEFSAKVVPFLVAQGKQVIDLSGAFRLQNTALFEEYYGFAHPAPELLARAVYGLPESNGKALKGAQLIAVAGCYPTVSILSLLPATSHGLLAGMPVIHAVSGVSGAGRSAKLTTSFCEVSLQAYGIDQHRHAPEIEQALAQEVVFTPHLGNFKRGIVVTITAPLVAGVSAADLWAVYQSFYADYFAIKLRSTPPKVDQVVHSPYLHLSLRSVKQGRFIQLFAAIDNLMKGAASSAIQCCNLSHGWPEACGLQPLAMEVAA
jgi:N-acetyl-gamma-glutamyl-phosphate reductase